MNVVEILFDHTCDKLVILTTKHICRYYIWGGFSKTVRQEGFNNLIAIILQEIKIMKKDDITRGNRNKKKYIKGKRQRVDSSNQITEEACLC